MHQGRTVLAQVTYRESLRDIEACLGARGAALYHCGIRGRVSRSNLAYANAHRPAALFAEVTMLLMRRAKRLHEDSTTELGLDGPLLAIDSTLIELSIQPGAYYVFDRGYLDFSRFHRVHESGAWFVTRAKSSLRFYVKRSRGVDKATGLRCDQLIRASSREARRGYPDTLRRIRCVSVRPGASLTGTFGPSIGSDDRP